MRGEDLGEHLPEQEGFARGELRAAQHDLREGLPALRLRDPGALAGVVSLRGILG
jgi:hypothetical protein